jgi:hypothetical protein
MLPMFRDFERSSRRQNLRNGGDACAGIFHVPEGSLFLLETVKRAYFESRGHFFRFSLFNPGFLMRQTTVFALDKHKKTPAALLL